MARKSRRQVPSAPPSNRTPVRRQDFDAAFWTFAALLVPITVLAYQPAWHGGLLWDDDGHVTKAALRSLGGVWRIWFEPGATQQYYPVVHTAFWVQFHLWGLDSTGYHLVNILLHAASACLLAAMLRRLGVRGAWLAGAAFALHPVQVESVAWITELKNTLSGALYFSAALVYLHFDERRTRSLYWGAFALFVLALFSKSVTATLPAGWLVVCWWRRGRIEWRRDVRPLLPFFAAGAASGAMTVWMERAFIGAEGAAFNFTIVERTLIAGRAICFYLGTLVWPANLAFTYSRWQVSQAVWWQYLYPAAVLAVLAVLWRLRGWSRAPLAALLFFVVTLGPALGFVNVYPFKYAFVADHFQYLACASIVALAAASVTAAAERWARFVPQMPAIWIGAILLAPLVVITWRDSHAYAGKEVLYRTTIARNPEAWLAHNNLAALLLDQPVPDAAQALVHAREAVRLAPEQAATEFNLGLALEASGDLDGAARAYRAAIDHATPAEREGTRIALVRDRLASVMGANDDRYARGLAFEQAQQFDRAVEEFRAVVAAVPGHAGARQHLGRALHSLGRREEAVAAYQAALAVDPASADTHNDLGVALAELGRFREAEPHFAEAVRLRPDDAEARANLARARLMIQRGGRRGGLDK